MNYQETLDFLYHQLPMYQRQGQTAYKKDLSNTLVILEATGNPQQRIKTIHIAGTNGKGSVTHMIAAGLQAQGYRVGVYSSPHYIDFRERIKINGQFIAKNKVIDYVQNLASVIEEIRPSFFELTVGMAFDYFAKEQVDFAVIETGLGGRLDSTNVILPMLSVITNISMDHVDILGNTLEKIAGEKAGIIKPDTPCLIGERQEDLVHVFRDKAGKLNAPISWAEDLVQLNGVVLRLGNTNLLDDELLTLDGPFDHLNLRTALASLTLLDGMGVDISWDKVKGFLPDFARKTYYIGRWQRIQKNPDVLTDSAHNAAGIAKTISKVLELGYKQIHFVIGFSSDKNLTKVLTYFPRNAKYYFVKANVPRGMSAKKLRASAEHFGLKGKAYTSVRRGLAAARRRCKKEEMIYVGGSVFVVAEVL